MSPGTDPTVGSDMGSDPAASGTYGAADVADGEAASAGRSHGPARAVYVISVAAELAGVHPQTLRIYERRGLVDPSRTGGGSRRYSQDDIDRLRHIQDLTNAGLNLEGVRKVLQLEREVEALRQQLNAARNELRAVRAEALEAVERTHRHYRRDLVPVGQTAIVWRQQRPEKSRR